MMTFYCEDGIGIIIYETHNDRDNDFEETNKMWVEDGEVLPAPTNRLDILVPMEMTHKQIKEQIQRATDRITLRYALERVIQRMIP
jgi:hypothetical protein